MSQQPLPELGVAMLDRPDLPRTSGGTAFSGRGPHRFSSLSSLPTGTTWWLNAGYKEFKKDGIYLMSNMRNDQLLRIPQGQILQELGLADTPAPDQAEALHGVLKETVEFVHRQLHPVEKLFDRLDWHLKALVRDMDMYELTPQLLSAARNAHTYLSPSPNSGVRHQALRTYCAPRRPRMEQMLALPAPSPKAKWRWQSYRGVADSRKLWELAGPGALVEISIANPEEIVGQVAPFGYMTRANSTHRVWSSLPEAMWYADRAEVEVRGFWQPTEVCRVQDWLYKVPQDPENYDFSYSAAIAYEALLYALLHTSQEGAAKNGREPLAAYISGYDRLQMIMTAIRIQKAGYSPISSSCGGRVVVGANPYTIRELDELCIGLGLEPPLCPA